MVSVALIIMEKTAPFQGTGEVFAKLVPNAPNAMQDVAQIFSLSAKRQIYDVNMIVMMPRSSSQKKKRKEKKGPAMDWQLGIKINKNRSCL